MPRPYHSPSSVKLGARCKRAWALCYIAGLREPEISWAAIEAGAPHEPRQRSTALGKAGHTVLEDWYEHRTPAWQSFPGQVMHAGVHLLPHPDNVEQALVESPIGSERIDNPDPNGPQSARTIDGVRWAGFKDLVAYAPGELARLEIDAPDGWALFDYKTSAHIQRYALSPAELAADLQANLYAYDVCERFALDVIPARWVYFETKRVRRARPVDTTIARARALDVIAPFNAIARELDTIAAVDSAEMNPQACGDYGGCQYHVSRGGPCNARRSIGGLIQARVKKDTNTMPLDPKLKSKFDKFTKKNAEAPEESEAPEEAEAETEAPEAETEAPAETPAPKKPGPKPGAAKPAVAGAKPSKLSKLVADLEAAEARVTEIKAQIREAPYR
jgi:hypothetical protein